MHFKQKYFLKYFFTFVEILNHSPTKDLSNRKKQQFSASNVGRDNPPTIYKVLTHKRYTLCAHCIPIGTVEIYSILSF